MVDLDNKLRLGPYALLKPLGQTPLAARWLGLHESDHTTHVLYRFPPCHDKAEQRRFLAAVQKSQRVNNPHVLAITHFSFEPSHRPWLVTPYTGDVDGLLALTRLLRSKGGAMTVSEAERAIIQLLDASAAAGKVGGGGVGGLQHGPISADEAMVDRHGRVCVELYGLARGLRGLAPSAEVARDEVRSIVELGYQMVTGLRAEEPLIPAGRLVRRLDAAWDRWLERGLDPMSGYATAAEAIAALPGRVQTEDVRGPMITVRTVLGRFRSAMGAS